jgi:hypothetical protein
MGSYGLNATGSCRIESVRGVEPIANRHAPTAIVYDKIVDTLTKEKVWRLYSSYGELPSDFPVF